MIKTKPFSISKFVVQKAYERVKQERGSAEVDGLRLENFEEDRRNHLYFDPVNHDWLRKFLRQKIADPVILRLIDKWLRAGIMANGVKISKEDGVPHSGPVS